MGTLVSSCNHCVDGRTTVSRPVHAAHRQVFFFILLSGFPRAYVLQGKQLSLPGN